MSDTTVTVMGNLTRDPDLKYTPSGQAVCQLGIAVNKRWFDKATEEWKERVSFFNAVAWGELGENVAESFAKGDRVLISGELEQRSWETEEGDKRSAVELKVNDMGGSVRWATSTMTRTKRSADRAPHPADEREPAMAGGGGAPAVDEEPF